MVVRLCASEGLHADNGSSGQTVGPKNKGHDGIWLASSQFLTSSSGSHLIVPSAGHSAYSNLIYCACDIYIVLSRLQDPSRVCQSQQPT